LTLGDIKELCELMEKYTISELNIGGLELKRPPIMPLPVPSKKEIAEPIGDESVEMATPERLEEQLYRLGQEI
jgi:hypothetical protein